MTDPIQRILDVVEQRSGMTELEIAKAVFGPSAVQQDVNRECRTLVSLGMVERLGVGGPGDPYTYRRSNNTPAAVTMARLRSTSTQD
jgi:hypothetical protein